MLSRVADSLYWMSRYLERAEHTARLVDVHLDLMLDQGPHSGAAHPRILLQSLNFKTEDNKGARQTANETPEDVYALARTLTFDRSNTNSIVSCIVTARENARQIREQISTEMYEQLNRLYLKVMAPDVQEIWNAQPAEFFADVKESCHLFSGVADETFAHGEAYLFMRVGKNLERAGATLNLLKAHAPSLADPKAATAGSYMEWVSLLRSCTSFESYCREYTADLRAERILEFLLLDEEMPRSVRFCTTQIETALETIAVLTGRHKDSKLLRSAGKLRSTFDYASIEDILSGDLTNFLGDVRSQCSAVHSALFATYIGYTVETAVAIA
jgi:uncharacterized alpha-E superfamily protein